MFEQEVTPRFNIRLLMEITKIVSVRSPPKNKNKKTKKIPKAKPLTLWQVKKNFLYVNKPAIKITINILF